MHKACRYLVVQNLIMYTSKISRSGDKKTVEILVKYGGKVNVLNNLNESPLHIAVDYSDNVELVQFLLEQ